MRSKIKHRVSAVCFTANGQVIIPASLRKEFAIADGTKAIVEATPEGILLKPVTSLATVRRLRGILKRKPAGKSFDEEWADHKREERDVESR